jgi:hypothetical protein
LDLYVSKRASVLDKWGKPQPLPNVNSVVQDSCPTLSPDEYRLYFVSARPGGCGGQDIYVSRRQDRRDDLGWQPPKNLGCQSEGHVNSSSRELTLTLFEDETGTEVMYFGSDRPGGAGRFDIYESRMRGDDTFGPATLVKELSGSTVEFCPAVRRDGLEIVFCSDRDGGKGNLDLWTASRESTEGSWSVPVNLAILNSTALDGNKMSFSFDGRQLYFTSGRSGKNQDLYVTTREKLHGQKK